MVLINKHAKFSSHISIINDSPLIKALIDPKSQNNIN